MIKPTIGRIVWFYETADESGQPMAAQVCYVHNDKLVNLAVTDHHGQHMRRTSVTLVQDGELPMGMHCRWMPYQQAQAAKHA